MSVRVFIADERNKCIENISDRYVCQSRIFVELNEVDEVGY
jgi:hypothetical protein